MKKNEQDIEVETTVDRHREKEPIKNIVNTEERVVGSNEQFRINFYQFILIL